jgi:hypothetical protein
MVTSTLPAAASTAADTKPPTVTWIAAIFPIEPGCKVVFRVHLSTDNRTPQNQIRYQVFSNGVPIPGGPWLADTRSSPPGYGWVYIAVAPAPTAQRFTVEAVDQAGNYTQPSFAVSRTIPGPC